MVYATLRKIVRMRQGTLVSGERQAPLFIEQRAQSQEVQGSHKVRY